MEECLLAKESIITEGFGTIKERLDFIEGELKERYFNIKWLGIKGEGEEIKDALEKLFLCSEKRREYKNTSWKL